MKFDPDKVDVIDFLEALDVENVIEATEKEVKFSCPFPGHQHGDQNPSAYMNRETTAWMCHGCKRKGNAVTFLSEIGTISIMESVRFLKERYGAGSADPDSVSMTKELERFIEKKRRPVETGFDVILDEKAGEQFLTDWQKLYEMDDRPEWATYMLFERGFHPETLDSWQIGYDEDSGRITIPVRDERGELAGFKARTWDGRKPKYLVLGEGQYGWPRYQKSRIVFGMYQVLDFLFAAGDDPLIGIPDLIICEGELNAMAMWEMGFESTVAVSGSDFSNAQSRIIRRYADSVIVYFDSDVSGNDGTVEVVNALKDFLPVKVVPDHEGDANDALVRSDLDSVRSLVNNAESVTRIMMDAVRSQ